MIIYGTRGVNLTKKKGEFYCPECAKRQDYKLIHVRRFFTLYFIPIIPLDLVGTYIECQRCKGTFKEQVLSYSPEKERQQQEQFQAQYLEALKNVMLLMMMADGVIEEAEVKQLQDLYGKLTGGKQLSEQMIRQEGKQLVQSGASVKVYVQKVYPLLNLEGKLIILRAALEIASADGQFQPEEQKLIADLANSLQIPKSKLNETIKQFFPNA